METGERFNTCSHLLGLLLALAGAAALLSRLPEGAGGGRIAGAWVFACATVAVYAASTFFHGSRGSAKRRWERADHCAIYLLIAGTYTPFALATAPGPWRWALLCAVWVVALAGMRRELQGPGPAPSLWRYLGMGWLCVMAALPLAMSLRSEALVWLVAGALLYTAGTVFYRNRGGWRHAHGAWHLFVLGGTVSHYQAVQAVSIGLG